MNSSMAGVVYVLGSLTCITCTLLLMRGYSRTRVRLLMWSSVFFAALTVDNVILVFDLIVLPQVELTLLRHSATLVGLGSLIFGLVWESE